VAQHQCTAALFRAKLNPRCSVLLCRTISQQPVCQVQSQLWRFALHTGVQRPSTNVLQLCSGQNVFPTDQCCIARQAHSRQCVTGVTSMEVSSSYRCAVAQHKCPAAVFRARCIIHCSVLLFKPGSQQAVCHCSYTYKDLLFIQVCCGPAPMHCSFV